MVSDKTKSLPEMQEQMRKDFASMKRIAKFKETQKGNIDIDRFKEILQYYYDHQGVSIDV